MNTTLLPPLRPIMSALSRQRMMPILVVVQIALACAILSNALFLLQRQMAPMVMADDIVPNQLLLVDQLVAGPGKWDDVSVQSGVRALLSIPGVRSVSPAMGLPMRQSMTFTLSMESPSGIHVVASGFAGDRLIGTLGLELTRGRDFTDDDYAATPAIFGTDSGAAKPVILTEALARHLFPDGHAIGGYLRGDEGPDDHARYVVIGLVRHLMRYQLDMLDDGQAEYAVLYPARKFAGIPIMAYAVRADPQQRDGVRAAIPGVLARQFGDRLMRGILPVVDDYEHLRGEAFAHRRAAVWLLGTVCAVVAVITMVGIASLSGYWIEQRTRQIGIRRALGATRSQVLAHFLYENMLLTILGLGIGMPLAYLANQWLMASYELPRLPWYYLPVGAAALWVLGQLSVLGPALRAAAVPPAVATRTA